MPVAQPYTAVSSGGLDLISSPYELLRTPNIATRLTNFEVSNDGGYRRINGHTRLGAGSATNPGTSTRIWGVQPYGLGLVVCVATSVYYSEDGISWLQINKDTTGSGKTEAQMGATAALDRPNQACAQLKLMSAPNGRTTTTYGSLNIATGNDLLARFRIEGTGAGRLFFYEHYTAGTPVTGDLIEIHEKHLCVVDKTNAPSTIVYSANNDDSDFTGTGSGSITISDKIVGIKSFRRDLIIFAENSIYKLININNASTVAIEQITLNLGCSVGESIQEIGGDLIFLGPDGFRTIAGTDRISDTELGTLSKKIQPLVIDILSNKDNLIFSSVVLRGKNQYRFFYSDTTKAETVQKGIIGTLRPNQETGSLGYEWSQTSGIEVTAIGSGYNASGVEQAYHGDLDGEIFTHDFGNTFNGTSVKYEYSTPDIDFGDAGLRKTMHYMLLSVKPEGASDIKLQLEYDFRSPNIVQPSQQDVGTILYPSYYGSAIYGTDLYGAAIYPTKRVNLRGSGTSTAFNFSGEDANPPFTITGFYITFVPMDRR